MKRVLSAAIGVTALAIAVPAQAADLPIKGPVVAVSAFSWAGCYIGANAGVIGSAGRISLSPSGDYLLAVNIFSNPANSGPISNTYSPSDWGGTLGAQVGCNWQTSPNFIWGFETDLNWSGVNARVNASYPAITLPAFPGTPISPHTENVSSKLEWFSTFRGRVGWAADRLLIYGTAGLALASINTRTSVIFANVPFFIQNSNFQGSDDRTRVGYAVGTGLEYAFGNNWTFRTEYLFLNFGTHAFNSPCINAAVGCSPGNFTWATRVRTRDHVVRVALNWRFGG